jgi:uncharacterized protein YcbX
MLHKILPDGAGRKTMQLTAFPIMTRFLTDIVFDDDSDSEQEEGGNGRIIVTFHPPAGSRDDEEEKGIRTLEIPLQPDVEGLDVIDIELVGGPTKGYDMGAKYNEWFSACFGFEVSLLYVGLNTRPVLGNFNPNTTDAKPAHAADEKSGGGWISSIASSISYLSGTAKPEPIEVGIAFQDLASYLVVSETSRDDVSTRLPDGEEMDITKFRPGIVVKGSETAFEEDFWAEIKIGGDESEATMALTANCARCISLNIDFETGKPGTGESGKVLKKLMKDRRIDVGEKYSPIFGRFGFLTKSGEENPHIAVGDRVEVTKRNEEHTKLCEFPPSTHFSPALSIPRSWCCCLEVDTNMITTDWPGVCEY